MFLNTTENLRNYAAVGNRKCFTVLKNDDILEKKWISGCPSGV